MAVDYVINMLNVWLIAPSKQMELVLLQERSFHDERVVEEGVANVLDHDSSIYEGRFLERVDVNLMQLHLWLELGSEIVDEVSEGWLCGGVLQKRADLLVDDLHYKATD